MLQVLASDAEIDRAGVVVPVADYTCGIEELPPHARIGIPRAFFFDDLDPEVAAAVEKAIQVFRDLGCEIRDDLRLEVPIDRTLASGEAYAYHKEFVERSPGLYQPATLARIKSGEKISDADMLRAKQELALSRVAIRKIFDDVEILLTPTVPIPPPVIAELKKNPDQLRPTELMMLGNTRPFNVWGIPAISIPCGFTKDGMPIGLQLAAASGQSLLLQVAYAYEQATEWHKHVPSLINS